MDKTTSEVRLSQWKAIIEECENRPTSITKHQWLMDNNIPEKQYYYWLRKVRKAVYSELQAPLLPAPSKPQDVALVEIATEEIAPPKEPAPAVVIRTKKSTIELSSALSDEVLLKLFKAVSHAL